LRVLRREQQTIRQISDANRFKRDPYQYARDLFDPPLSGKPTFSKETAEEYFTTTYRDPGRDYKYQAPPGLPRPPLPSFAFDSRPPSKEELAATVRRKATARLQESTVFPTLSTNVVRSCCMLFGLWFVVFGDLSGFPFLLGLQGRGRYRNLRRVPIIPH